MNIRSLHLKNFRRFTDLEITGVPQNAKLVLLIGSNGSGKTCVFDAFEVMNSWSHELANHDHSYNKDTRMDLHISLQVANGQEFNYKGLTTPPKGSFYGRTSFRQVPRLTRKTLGGPGGPLNIPMDSDRPRMYIDRDERFENDIERITGDILRDFFRSKRPLEELRSLYIDPLNRAFENIFGTTNGTRLELLQLIPPLDGKTAQIMFRKGTSEFHYDSLSAGEKEVVNILFNLLARKEYFTDSIYFFDEIDLHLNTKLQYNFLKEITEHWIPDNCQLWTASHSLGFIQFANEYENGCIIDFDDVDFDMAQVLSPRPKNSFEVFEVAAPKEMIAQIFQGKTIIYCENEDMPVYNSLLLKDTIFFKAIDKNDAFQKAKNFTNDCLVDRDYLTDLEITELRKTYEFLHLLPYYSIENLYYHPDNLAEYYGSLGKPFDTNVYKEKLRQVRDEKMADISLGIAMARRSYQYYTGKHPNLRKVFEANSSAVLDMLKSDDFNTFYKVFPAKDYATTLPERQNVGAYELGKTTWFKKRIEEALA